MKKGFLPLILSCISLSVCLAENNVVILQDTLTREAINLDEVVVTGTRVPVPRDVIPVPISVIHRSTIEQSEETSLLPVLMQQVPGLFVTSWGVAGYGVSAGAAGGINMRGFAGGA